MNHLHVFFSHAADTSPGGRPRDVYPGTPAADRLGVRALDTVGWSGGNTMDVTSLIGQIVESLEPGAMVTRFVMVAEVIDADGKRGLWADTHEGATRWDTYGLLTYALELEKIAQSFDDDEDEDTEA